MVELFYALAATLTGFAVSVEILYSGLRKKKIYGARDCAANLILYAGFFAINLIWAHWILAIYVHLSDHALVQLTSGGWHVGTNGLWWEWLLLFILEDLCFYGFHRASHRVQLFWASHVTHHSSAFFNMSVAFRQTWIPFPAILFWLPLPLLGFDPLMIMIVQACSLLYQELLHTRAVPRLGPLEWIFNTPQHHAVHHASNAAHLDKNYGGVLIIWDRLFGSFSRQNDEPLRFGLTVPVTSNNPIYLAFHGWLETAGLAVRERSLRPLLAPPPRYESRR